MKRLTISLVSALLLSAAAAAQPNEVRIESPGPPPPETVSVSLVGAPGSTAYCYWVVTIYPIGKSEPRGACLNNAPPLSGARYVRVNWSASPGATGYDVVRSTRPDNFASCAACAVTLNTSSLTVNDQGGGLSAYTIATAPPVAATMKINNRDYAAAQVEVSRTVRAPAFVGDGSQLTNVSGSGGGLLLFAPASGSGATYSGTVTGATYANGLAIVFVPDVTNSGTSPEINLNSQGNRTLYRRSGNALAAGQLVVGRPYPIIYQAGVFYLADQDYAGDGAATAVDYSTSPPQVKLIPGSVCQTDDACEPTGLQDHSGAAGWLPPTKTVAGLPAAAGVTGQVFMVTDAASLTSLGAGGGSTRAWFVSNGSSYVALAGSAGASTETAKLLCDVTSGTNVVGTGSTIVIATCNVDANTFDIGDGVRVEWALKRVSGSGEPIFRGKVGNGGVPQGGFTATGDMVFTADWEVTGNTTIALRGARGFRMAGFSVDRTNGDHVAVPSNFDRTTTTAFELDTAGVHIPSMEEWQFIYFRVWRLRP